MHFLLAFAALSLFPSSVVNGQQGTEAPPAHVPLRAADQAGASAGHVIDGPAPPDLPGAMARDADGRATIRAIKLSGPLRLDGALDEAIYQSTPGFGGLLQTAPRYGQPSTEKTDIWLSFDADHIYVSARCWDTAPPEKWIANELRRDTNQMRQNDHFGVGFDTFYDRRSGFMFYANPLGGFADYSVVDEGPPNSDWNPVWNVRTGRFDGRPSTTPTANSART